MNLKIISCNVFLREVCLCVADSPHVIDLEFTELGEHVHCDLLRTGLQARIDAAGGAARRYDAIVLCFGICGNSTIGLRAGSIPLVLPRAHDCCAVLLGSKDVFRQHFSENPSTPFGSAGYMERGDYYLRTVDGQSTVQVGDAYQAYVEQYGEENARYIWETMHPQQEGNRRAVFIDVPETRSLGYEAKFRQQAQSEGRDVTTLPGSLRWIRNLIHGDWQAEDVLIVPAGKAIAGVYDWTEVIRVGE
jgi:hypothetical protein